jgi:ATP-dependent exoDNAse (exonuclease V) alpha subunit
VTNKRTDALSAAMADNAVLIDTGRANDIQFQSAVGGRPAVFLPKPQNSKDAVKRATAAMLDIYKEIIKDKEAKENILLHQVVLLKNTGIDGRNVLNRACESALIKLRVLRPPSGGGVRIRTKSDGKPLYLYIGKKITFTKKYKSIVDKKKNVISDLVLNGEQGIVSSVKVKKRRKKRIILVEFEQPESNKRKKVLIHRIDGIDPFHVDDGFACTTNKAQGSEWPYVIYWLEDNPGPHWTREYSYVALSRCKTTCWVVGNKYDFYKMCESRAPKRHTLLSTFFQSWKFDPQLLVDEKTEHVSLRNFELLELMDTDKLCSPTPKDPKKAFPVNR